MTTLHQSHEDISPTQLDNQPEKIRWRDRLRKGIGAKAAAVAATGAALISFNACAASSHETSAIPEQTTTSAPAHPSSSKASAETSPSTEPSASTSPSAETSSSTEGELTVSSLELPADQTPEELSTLVWQDRLTQWSNAGESPEVAKKAFNLGIDGGNKYLATIAKKNADLFAKSLLVKNWEDNPDLVKFVNGLEDENLFNLKLFVRTSPSMGDPANKEAYRTWDTVDGDVSVTSKDGNEVSIDTPLEQHDNSKENTALYFAPDLKVDGHTYTATATFKKDGDRTVITDALLHQ